MQMSENPVQQMAAIPLVVMGPMPRNEVGSSWTQVADLPTCTGVRKSRGSASSDNGLCIEKRGMFCLTLLMPTINNFGQASNDPSEQIVEHSVIMVSMLQSQVCLVCYNWC